MRYPLLARSVLSGAGKGPRSPAVDLVSIRDSSDGESFEVVWLIDVYRVEDELSRVCVYGGGEGGMGVANGEQGLPASPELEGNP